MGRGKLRHKQEQPAIANKETELWPVPQEWLHHPANLSELDALIEDFSKWIKERWDGETPENPDQQRLLKWQRFRDSFGTGDELWWFSSPHEDWVRLLGLAGFTLVRLGKSVDSIIVRLN